MSTLFAETMINDYVDLGLGEKKNSLTILSHDHDTLVELEAIEDEGKTVGLAIFANGVLSESLNYADKDFSVKLASSMVGLLNG